MAIKSNDSAQEVVGGMKLYSGLTNMSVVMVNPTLEELQSNDINFKQDPEYFVEINGTEYFKLAFWLRNSDLTVRMEILMTDNFRQSKTSKYQWMNNIGQDTWSEESPDTNEKLSWFKPEGQRKAYDGEETLIRFVKAWANVASGDEVYFETMNKIAKGDATEIQALVAALKDNAVRVLLGVKDGKYQQVYMRYFGRVKPQRDDLFIKALNDDYGSFNADFNADLKWGAHVSTATLVTPDTIKEEDDWIEEPATAGNGQANNDDDLPF